MQSKLLSYKLIRCFSYLDPAELMFKMLLLVAFKESPRLITFLPLVLKLRNRYISSWLTSSIFPGRDAPLERPLFGGNKRLEEFTPPPPYAGDVYPDAYAPSRALLIFDALLEPALAPP